MWAFNVLELAYKGQVSCLSKSRLNSTWGIMDIASTNVSSICLG